MWVSSGSQEASANGGCTMLRQLAAEDHVHYQLMLMVPGSGTCNAGPQVIEELVLRLQEVSCNSGEASGGNGCNFGATSD